jgi:hypothetical protein
MVQDLVKLAASLRQLDFASKPDVRFGSKGDIGRQPDWVCFTSKSGHRRRRMRCRLWVNKRHRGLGLTPTKAADK